VTFKPTHEFRGLELERDEKVDKSLGINEEYLGFRDENYRTFMIPADYVTTLRPKPGEIWRFTLYGGLRIVTSDLTFIDTDGDEVGDAVDFAEGQYEKVLNADGTPA